jgi:flagellar motor component MotA
MTFTRLVLALGVLVLLAFVVVMAIAVGGVYTPVVALVALFILIGGGNLLYGRHSHGATAKARVRPAQEAQNQAIDQAQHEARRQRELARQHRAEARQARRTRRARPGEGIDA